MTTDALTEEAFTRNLNTKFHVTAEGGPGVELELAEVVGYKSGPNEQQGLERFSAFFDGPGDICLRQATYTFEHERMGSFPLFIVPVGKNERGYRYEAVFNNTKRSER